MSDAKKMGIKKGVISGGSMGFVYLVMFSIYALAFWYGAKLVREEPDNYSVGNMLVVSYLFSYLFDGYIDVGLFGWCISWDWLVIHTLHG